MKRILYVILNILATIFEVSFFYYIFIRAFNDDKIVGLGYLIIYSMFLLIMIILSFNKKSIFHTIDFPEKLNNQIVDIYKNFKKKYPKLLITFHYVDDERFLEPAAYLDGRIYVNAKFKISPVFFDGIIAHELGHAVSGLVKYKIIHLLRFTSAFSRGIYSVRLKGRKKFTGLSGKIMDVIFLIIYHTLSIMDHLTTFPFFREDELIANSYAVKSNYGESLRYFYYNSMIYSSDDLKFIRKYYDFKHPSAEYMLKKIEQEMNLAAAEKDIYAVNNHIYKVKNTKNIQDKFNKIMNWYKFKEAQNIDVIYYDLGKIYEIGKYRVSPDIDIALSYYNKAKKLDYLPAVLEIVKLTFFKKEFTAFDDILYLVKNNEIRAYIYLAYAYGYGKGTSLDIEKSDYWFNKAAKANIQEANLYLKLKNNSYVYNNQSFKNIEIEKDEFIFDNLNQVRRIYNNKISTYKLLLKHNQIELLNDDFKRYTLMIFTGNKLIRKNVIGINEDGKVVNTNVFYVKKDSQ